MSALPTPDDAVRQLTDTRRRASPDDLSRLTGTEYPGLYAWFVDRDGAEHLAEGIGLPVRQGLIYAGQAGAGTSRATLGSRIRGNHLGSDIYGSTFRLTLTSALRERLALEPIGGGHMGREGERRLTAWILEHLAVAVARYPDRARLDVFEGEVLDLLDPPLNIAKRPPSSTRARLTALRRPFGKAASPVSIPATDAGAAKVAPYVERPDAGPTPEELARELGLPNAKRVRGFLRDRYPRPGSALWSRWGPLTPDMERAVRDRFGGDR
ncbi:MAG TPA: hypothetical protein VM427_06855 [Patescibacteria group bacterium]|nr:hypothetical protein [Patescibacteria group bacterium]